MLIEFRVRNYRSLRDEQVLSLVASKDATHEATHTLATDLPSAPRVLRTAVLYGQNAGGKTNVLRAIDFMRLMVLLSATAQAGQPIAHTPFLFDTDTAKQPSSFEITVRIDGVRYQYGFSLTSERITHELLLVYKSFKPQRWFERRFDPATGKDHFEFSAHLSGPKTLWRDATKPNSLFLSTAVQLNSEPLRPLFDWFANKLLILSLGAGISLGHPLQESLSWLKDPELKGIICDFLITADLSIVDIQVTSRRATGPNVLIDAATGQAMSNVEHEVQDIFFHHKTDAGSALLALSDESLGTQRYFALSGPVLGGLIAGQTLIVDELDTSLHPLLVRRLLDLFHTPGVNDQGGQLLFSTHDSSLLSQEIFRRDQIWFVEKRGDQSSRLYPLTEFSPRKNEALEAGYLAGRYGALPFFRDPPPIPKAKS